MPMRIGTLLIGTMRTGPQGVAGDLEPIAPIESAATSLAVGPGHHGRSWFFTANDPIAVTADQAAPGVTLALHQAGDGQISIVAGEGVTLRYPSELSNPKSTGRYATLVLKWRSATEVWLYIDLEPARVAVTDGAT